MRVGDSRELFEEVNRKVEPRYRMAASHVQRNLAAAEVQEKLARFRMAQQQRQLESELLRVQRSYEWEMRLHMERPSPHTLCSCQKASCN
jgi:hypothetical protein